MKEMDFTVETIKELMDKMAQTNLGVMELECGDLRLKLEAKTQPVEVVTVPGAVPVPVTPAPVSAAPSVLAESVPAKEEKLAESTTGTTVTAPIVGTFYAAPGPEKESFVKVGQTVKKGDVLFIIESMKLMNEVQSECDGVVSQIFVKSGEGVEYGQPIMIIQ